jgi:hypothetical protein
MRMWKVSPKKLCVKHLLGEHVEMHMFRSNVVKKRNLSGYIKKGLVEIHNIKKRHDELAREMVLRGMKHNSPMKKFKGKVLGKVDIAKNEKELIKRCKECRKLN